MRRVVVVDVVFVSSPFFQCVHTCVCACVCPCVFVSVCICVCVCVCLRASEFLSVSLTLTLALARWLSAEGSKSVFSHTRSSLFRVCVSVDHRSPKQLVGK